MGNRLLTGQLTVYICVCKLRMKKKIIQYSLILLVAVVYSCSPIEECEIVELTTDVQGKKVLVNILAKSTDDLVQYNWHFSDGFSKATTESNVEHVFTQNGDYAVEVEAEGLNGEHCYYQSFFVIEDSTIIRDTCDIDISNIEIDKGHMFAEATIEGSYDNAIFIWKTGFEDYDTTYVPNFEMEYISKGNHQLKVSYVQGGCKDSAITYVKINQLSPQCHLGEITIPQVQGRFVIFPNFLTPIPGNPIYTYDFGDGSDIKKLGSSFFRHRYTNSGVYKIKVQLEFENGECYKERVFYVRINIPNDDDNSNDNWNNDNPNNNAQNEGVNQDGDYPIYESGDWSNDTIW